MLPGLDAEKFMGCDLGDCCDLELAGVCQQMSWECYRA